MEFVPLAALTSSLQSIEPDSSDCPICTQTFVTDEALQIHMDSAHPGWAQLLCSSFLAAIPRENG